MIHLKLNLTDTEKAWLDDLTDGKDSEKMKVLFGYLKEVVGNWQIPLLKLENGEPYKFADKVITKSDLLPHAMIDEPDGDMIIGDKMADKLCRTFSLIRNLFPATANMTVNEWVHAMLKEVLLQRKADFDRHELDKEVWQWHP